MKRMKFQIVLIFNSSFLLVVSPVEISVATFNLWNVMFNWEVRKHRIAEMIKESTADVIVFQEVRTHNDGSRNQLTDLQALLPEYRWKLFKEATEVSRPKDAVWSGWEKEGIGILSKQPITFFAMETLPYVKGPDTNKRVFLLASVFVSPGISIPIIAVHFSYDRQQQCSNARTVLKFVADKGIMQAVILGDFNTYNDFEWPIQLFTSLNKKAAMRACLMNQLGFMESLPQWSGVFTDVHHATNSKALTFSNMPVPGYESRPDRILATSTLEPVSVSMLGNGTYYRTHYRQRIFAARLSTLLYNSYLSFLGYAGFPCLHDCGPHGKCRCGVCIKSNSINRESCNLPDCVECRSSIFIFAVIILIFSVMIIIHLLYAMLCLLLGGSDFQGEAVFAILGCNCCLCNPNNFKSPNFNSKKFRILRRLQKWPLFRLPPCVLLFFAVILGLFVIFVGSHIFQDVIKTVSSVMDEEFFPSDHMMLISKLNIVNSGST